MKTVRHNNVPIVKAGTWQGIKGETVITLDHLAAMVESFPVWGRPCAFISHTDQRFARYARQNGEPAFGQFTNPRIFNGTLVADWVDVPERAYELARVAWPKRSAEIDFNKRDPATGKTYSAVLTGVALQSVEPAVTGLDDVAEMYATALAASPGTDPEVVGGFGDILEGGPVHAHPGETVHTGADVGSDSHSRSTEALMPLSPEEQAAIAASVTQAVLAALPAVVSAQLAATPPAVPVAPPAPVVADATQVAAQLAAALPAGYKLVTEQALADKDAALVAAQESAQLAAGKIAEQERTAFLAEGRAAGKITAENEPAWTSSYDQAPEVARVLLGAAAPAVPMAGASGLPPASAGGATVSTVDAADLAAHEAHRNYAARLGGYQLSKGA